MTMTTNDTCPVEPGVVVCLKSGGPSMTVASVQHREATCSWFDPNLEHKTAVFPVECLEPQDVSVRAQE